MTRPKLLIHVPRDMLEKYGQAGFGLYEALAGLVAKKRRLAACKPPKANASNGFDVSRAWVDRCSGSAGP